MSCPREERGLQGGIHNMRHLIDFLGLGDV